MLVWAIQAAGLNRAKIRDMIAYRNEPWNGVTGPIVFSSVLDDMGEVYLAKREKGKWRYYSRRELGLPAAPAPQPQEPAAREPFFDRARHPVDYAGPGGDDLPPAGLEEVRIGYFGPHDPADPDGGPAWVAAQMAVDEANAAGGCQGKPFRLFPVWSTNPWKSGASQLARLVYDDKVWAIVGGVDGPTTHLAEQVAVKAFVPLLNPFSSDKTIQRANVPWSFSCVPADDVLAEVVAEALAARVADKPFAVLSADGHDARALADEVVKCLAESHLVPRLRFECRPQTFDAAELATRIAQAKIEAVVIAAGAADAGRMVVGLRRAGYRGLVLGGPTLGRWQFVREAGAAADGALFPLLLAPGRPLAQFAANFERRAGSAPDYTAAQAYDAVRRTVAAIRQAGLNRAQIRDALQAQSPWEGVTGPAVWDNLGTATQAVGLGTIDQGQIVPAFNAHAGSGPCATGILPVSGAGTGGRPVAPRERSDPGTSAEAQLSKEPSL